MKKHRGWVRLTGTYPRCFFFVKEMFTNPSLTRRGFRLRHRKCEKSKKKSHESRKPLRRKDFRVHLFYQHMTKKPPFSLKRAVFFCILLLFRSVLISGQRFDHTTSHRQRKTGLRRCLLSEACCFSSLHILAAAAALFLLRSPPSFAESGGLTAPRTLLWSLRSRHCGHAFFRPARSGSSGLPRDDR